MEEAIQIFSQEYKNYHQAPDEGSFYKFLTHEQMLELWVRHGVEILFEKMLRGRLTIIQIKALKQVMFRNLFKLEFGGQSPKAWIRECEPDEGDLSSILD